MRLHPPANKTKELVHIVLLIGKTPDQSSPRQMHKQPAASKKPIFFNGVRVADLPLINVPVKMPIIAEHIDELYSSSLPDRK